MADRELTFNYIELLVTWHHNKMINCCNFVASCTREEAIFLLDRFNDLLLSQAKRVRSRFMTIGIGASWASGRMNRGYKGQLKKIDRRIVRKMKKTLKKRSIEAYLVATDSGSTEEYSSDDDNTIPVGFLHPNLN